MDQLLDDTDRLSFELAEAAAIERVLNSYF